MPILSAIARSSCVGLLWLAIGGGANASGQVCPPAPEFARPGAKAASSLAIRDYKPVFEICRDPAFGAKIAIRRMSVNGAAYFLTVDPQTLATRIEAEACFACAPTTDAAQQSTRYLAAIAAASLPPKAQPAGRRYLRNAGLVHGEGEGAFVTGELCPSRLPLDRGFFEKLEATGRGAPVALSISGLWLQRHTADFQWLREHARSGALKITWVNHSFHHPYEIGRPLESNFLLGAGVAMQAEIMETEKLLIANGETPSVFFRFPGLISNPALMETLRANHLIALGADGWLAYGAKLRPGAVVLVHPNGNEPVGLRMFSRRLDEKGLPMPLRALNEAPAASAQPAASGACPADDGCPRSGDPN